MRRAWPGVVVGLLVGVVGWVLVLDPATAIAVGIGITTLFLVEQRLDPGTEPLRWLPPKAPRQGERRDALELTWALAGREGRISRHALQRTQEIAAHRLARHGLDLASDDDEPAVRALIGPRAHATLTCVREPWPRLSDIEHTAKVLERLGPGGATRTVRSNPR